MKTIRRTLSFVVVASLLFAAGTLVAEPASQPSSTDWPCWRGPTRDGVAPSSPKLLDKWPAGGPKRLWKSDYIFGGTSDGCACIVGASGKVLVYLDAKLPIAGDSYRPITAEVLKDWGWLPDLPAELAKKIEAARQDASFKGLKGLKNDPLTGKNSGPELDEYTKSL